MKEQKKLELIKESLNTYIGKQARVAIQLNEKEKTKDPYFPRMIAVHGILEKRDDDGSYRILDGPPEDRAVSYSYFSADDISCLLTCEGEEKLSCKSDCVIYLKGKTTHPYTHYKPKGDKNMSLVTAEGKSGSILVL